MRVLRAAVGVAALTAALLVPAAPAAASHTGSECGSAKAFTSTERWRDTSITEGLLLAAELFSDIADDLDITVPKIVAYPLKHAAAIAHYAVVRHNTLYSACIVGGHWADTDTLLLLQLQRGLALTTRPDAAQLVPGPTESPAFGADPYSGDDKPTLGLLTRPDSEDTSPGTGDDERVPQGVKQAVHAVVADMEQFTSCSCASARSYLAQADKALTAGSHKDAYRLYRLAYVNAVR